MGHSDKGCILYELISVESITRISSNTKQGHPRGLKNNQQDGQAVGRYVILAQCGLSTDLWIRVHPFWAKLSTPKGIDKRSTRQ